MTASPNAPAPPALPPAGGAAVILRIRAYGPPAPQGSKSAFAVRKKGGGYTGRTVMVDDNKTTLGPWRAAVTAAAVAAQKGLPAPPWSAGLLPIAVTITFLMPRPASHYTPRGALRAAAPRRPAGARMDIDKLCRAVLDALTDAGCWVDDGQVSALRAVKWYAHRGDPPGAIIEVSADE